jgi:hypothetical protein
LDGLGLPPITAVRGITVTEANAIAVKSVTGKGITVNETTVNAAASIQVAVKCIACITDIAFIIGAAVMVSRAAAVKVTRVAGRTFETARTARTASVPAIGAATVNTV